MPIYILSGRYSCYTGHLPGQLRNKRACSIAAGWAAPPAAPRRAPVRLWGAAISALAIYCRAGVCLATLLQDSTEG